MQLLKGKNVLVTGGTSGIGKAIACLFAKHGANVMIFGTNPERAEKALQEIIEAKADSSQRAGSMLVNVSKGQEVTSAVEQLLQEWGHMDILINNAGITRDTLLLKMTEEQWDEVLDVNLKSAFHLCKALYRSMMKAKGGSIVNISSIVGLVGAAGQTNYAASKAGMIGFTQSLAKELAGRGIRVNCVAPGYTETHMTEGLPAAVKEDFIKKVPMNRTGQPEEIAQAVLFLASDKASYITGQVLAVDGGMTM